MTLPIIVSDESGRNQGVVVGYASGPMGNVVAVVAWGRRLRAELLEDLRIEMVPTDYPSSELD